MDKRFQVFVSSTYEDLRTERQEVMQALLELDCIPSGMELFPAANEDQWTLIKKIIDECDYYVVISAGRYGSAGPDGQGYTELEYRYAIQQKKPVIAFLHKDPQQLPAAKVESTDEGRKKLQAFRELLQQRVCKHWESAADLGSVVSRSLVRLIKTTPAVGWVRADDAMDAHAAADALRLRRTIEELEIKLKEATLSAPAGTEELAQGNDVYSITFSFETTDAKRQNWTWKHYDVEVSWSSIFYEIGPLMLNEASDGELKDALNSLVEQYSEEERDEDEKLKGHRPYHFEISDHDIQTIKIQLRALGLIKRSEKPRSVRDQVTRWTLTPYGDRVLTNLRAVRKEQVDGQSNAAEAAIKEPESLEKAG